MASSGTHRLNNTWIEDSNKVDTFEEAYVIGKELGRFV
jgi:hypothetical protein